MEQQILVVMISKVFFSLIFLLMLNSCVTNKKVTSDTRYHSEALSACLKYMLETEGVLIGKYPCNTGHIYINSNLYLYASNRNMLYKEFIRNEKNKKQIENLCINIQGLKIESQTPCKYEVIPVMIIDPNGYTYYNSERSSPNGKYRNEKIHLASPVLFDNISKDYCVFLTIFYRQDQQHLRFSVKRKGGKWYVEDYKEWFLNK